MKPRAIARRFERLVTVYRDVGLRGVGSRLLQRIPDFLGRDDARHADWRRRKADADIAFDAANGTKTAGTQELFELNVIGENARHGVRHIASDPNSFVELMRRLDIDFGNYSFIDLGSGKGRVLLLAASFPFGRIIGVEFATELHHAAQENLAVFDSRGSDISRISLFLADAASYSFPVEPLIVYLFNPFGSQIVRRVAENALSSWRKSPRSMEVLYAHPVHLSEFVDVGWRVVDSSADCARLLPREGEKTSTQVRSHQGLAL